MDLLLHTETFIDSCHRLIGYDGKCSQLHGHTWKVEVWIRGNPSFQDKVGILFDFGNIKIIHDLLDHKFLNDIPPFNTINPTAENLCIFIYNKLFFLDLRRDALHYTVRVYETVVGKETYCQYGDAI